MITRKDRKQEGKHDWSGSCSPGSFVLNATFSVGIFEWVLTSDGKGLKKTAVKYRIKGYSSNPEAVYARSDEVCDVMDRGYIYETKSEVVKP
jgi:hypothetical protein